MATPYPGTAALVPTIAGVLLIASGPETSGPRHSSPAAADPVPRQDQLFALPVALADAHPGRAVPDGAAATRGCTPGQAVVLAALSIPVATASWFFVEEPFRRGVIPLPRPSRIVAAGVAVMVLVALVGTSFDFGAQSALAALDDPDGHCRRHSTPTELAVATPTPTPTPTLESIAPASLAPSATPTPAPGMTPALTFASEPAAAHVVRGHERHPAILGNAATDYEQPWHDNCLGWQATTTPNPSSKCIYGNPSGTYTVALVGDSHASALFPGVNAVAKAHGWKLIPYLKINCSFLDLSDLMWYGPPTIAYPQCETWNSAVVSKLQKDPPDLVHHLDEPLDLHGRRQRGERRHGERRADQDDPEDPGQFARS